MNLVRTTVRIKAKHRRKVIAIGYAAAVMAAFIISTAKNGEVIASIPSQEIILEHNIIEQDIAINQTAIQNLTTTYNENAENINKTKLVTKEIEVVKGDSFLAILTNIGLSYSEANRAITAYKPIFDARNIKIGQKIKFDIVEDNETNEILSLEKIVIEPSIGKKLVLNKNIDEDYTAKIIEDELIDEIVAAKGEINGALSVSMAKAGVPSRISASFTNIFSFSVDFKKDIRAGDEFEIIYENKINENGDVVKTGDIVYASITLRKQKIELYRYEDGKGNADYYTEKGVALKRTLHRKPLAMQNARVSSPFGKRRHPIYKNVRVHWGIDYAAPRGTPIFAAGDGVVEVAKYNGGYGKYIRIKHNSEYSTAYAHMHNYANGVKSGKRVKQGEVIGYVGNTGKSTGPHLHYEVIQNGKRINPATIRAATGENLKGNDLEKFKKRVAMLQNEHTTIFAKNEQQVAQK